MKKPTDDGLIQLIAVLRVLRCSQDEVAGLLHLSKGTVVSTERWLEQEDLNEVRKVLGDEALLSVVARELPILQIDTDKENLLVRAGHVDSDDILRHYREDWQPRLAEKHERELREVVREWTRQLRWPRHQDLREPWGDPGRCPEGDFCWQVFDEKEDTGRWLRVQIYCAVEDDPLFQQIREHLEGDNVWAVYDEFKDTGGKYRYACVELSDLIEEIEEEMRSVTLSDYGSFSDVEELQEVHRLARRLTELKNQITRRLIEVLHEERFPGRCSRCSPR